MRSSGLLIGRHGLDRIRWRCSQRLALPLPRSITHHPQHRGSATAPSRLRFEHGYFVSNSLLGRLDGSRTPKNDVSGSALGSTAGLPTEKPPPTPDSTADLPHRRRQATRKNASQATASPDDAGLPANASSILTEVAARQREGSLRRTLSALLSLAKPRLTVLIVLTAMAPYALYPVPQILSSTALASTAPSLSPLTLAFLTAGTALCSSSANALNMLYEPATDALMSRTRNRPLVRRLLTRRAAVLFAVLSGATGVAALHLGVNPTVAFLGAFNIALYAGVYTPLKRISVINTWVGALVGAIPPLMGCAAAAGQYTSGDGSPAELLLSGPAAGGWLFAALLFAWQFPHFMALSWGVRAEYRAAGLRMLAWTNPARNARVALRYSLVFIPWSVALCAAGVTEWSFAATSLPVNAWLVREAVRFWRHEGHSGSARGLFWASVWHLPVIMVLALLQKKGLWGRVWKGVMGEPELDEDEWEDVDDGPVGVLMPGEKSR